MQYRSYLLRLWHTRVEGKHQWRISLQDSETGQTENFTSMDKLVDYLQHDMNNISASAVAEGENDASGDH